MIRLNKKGDVISTDGFDGRKRKPKYESLTNVYFGDVSKSDGRVNAAVDLRKKKEYLAACARAKQAQAIQTAKIMAEQKKKDLQAMNRARDFKSNQRVRDLATGRALMHGHILESNPFVGDAFAGFGDATQEQRINPDSGDSIEISDQSGIREMRAYGASTWMENTTSEYYYNTVEDAQNSMTPGKVTMSTMVDTSLDPMTTLISFPYFRREPNLSIRIQKDIRRGTKLNPYVLLNKEQRSAITDYTGDHIPYVNPNSVVVGNPATAAAQTANFAVTPQGTIDDSMLDAQFTQQDPMKYASNSAVQPASVDAIDNSDYQNPSQAVADTVIAVTPSDQTIVQLQNALVKNAQQAVSAASAQTGLDPQVIKYGAAALLLLWVMR